MCYKTEKQKAIAAQMEEKLQSLPKFIRNYFPTLKSQVTRKNNYGIIVAMLKHFMDDGTINKTELADITPDDICNITMNDMIAYLDSLKSKNSPETVATKKNIFGGLWTYFVVSKNATENIVHDINKVNGDLFKVETTNVDDGIRVPTKQQINSFRKRLFDNNWGSFETIRNIAIVELIMGSGIRSEELIGLDMNDLHLEDENPNIYVLGKGKQDETKKDRVYISEKRIPAIREYLQIREKFLSECDIRTDAVFISNKRGRLSKSALDNVFRKYSDGEIAPHDLRHWYGTRLYDTAKNIKLVQYQLRHKNLETASRYYVKTNKEDLYKAVSNI